jgi:ankyrin repeat protein
VCCLAVNSLLDHGADPFIKDYKGQTPLQIVGQGDRDIPPQDKLEVEKLLRVSRARDRFCRVLR